MNSLIVVGGMIGLGKTSVAEVLGDHLGTEVFYESVEDNKILPLFYTSTPEEIKAKRYPFLLQLWFLDSKFKSMKEALNNENNILDRSIYEDWYFAKRNMELGRISELEMEIYERLATNMMAEIGEVPKKSPELMIYLKGSFETVINRIRMRGREYELDNELIEYYRFIWQGYDEWVMEHFDKENIITIDMDKMDIVKNEHDRNLLFKMVDQKMGNTIN